MHVTADWTQEQKDRLWGEISALTTAAIIEAKLEGRIGVLKPPVPGLQGLIAATDAQFAKLAGDVALAVAEVLVRMINEEHG